MHEITVCDLMTQDPVCVSPETSIFECAKLMVKKKVDSLIVAEDKSIVGLVTHSDLLWAMVRKPKEELTDKDLLIIYINLDSNARNYFKSIEDYLDNLNKYLSCQL